MATGTPVYLYSRRLSKMLIKNLIAALVRCRICCALPSSRTASFHLEPFGADGEWLRHCFGGEWITCEELAFAAIASSFSGVGKDQHEDSVKHWNYRAAGHKGRAGILLF